MRRDSRPGFSFYMSEHLLTDSPPPPRPGRLNLSDCLCRSHGDLNSWLGKPSLLRQAGDVVFAEYSGTAPLSLGIVGVSVRSSGRSSFGEPTVEWVQIRFSDPRIMWTTALRVLGFGMSGVRATESATGNPGTLVLNGLRAAKGSHTCRLIFRWDPQDMVPKGTPTLTIDYVQLGVVCAEA